MFLKKHWLDKLIFLVDYPIVFHHIRILIAVHAYWSSSKWMLIPNSNLIMFTLLFVNGKSHVLCTCDIGSDNFHTWNFFFLIFAHYWIQILNELQCYLPLVLYDNYFICINWLLVMCAKRDTSKMTTFIYLWETPIINWGGTYVLEGIDLFKFLGAFVLFVTILLCSLGCYLETSVSVSWCREETRWRLPCKEADIITRSRLLCNIFSVARAIFCEFF